MNFKENHESIELLLKDKEYRNEKRQKKQSFMKGVYIFSKFRDSKYRKIGLAAGEGGIFQRLKYYTICFPHEDEFFIDFIITTKTRKEPRKLEELFRQTSAISAHSFLLVHWTGYLGSEWAVSIDAKIPLGE